MIKSVYAIWVEVYANVQSVTDDIKWCLMGHTTEYQHTFFSQTVEQRLV